MGSSLGPAAANIYMAHFETIAREMAITSGFQFPRIWLRYVDDVLIFWNNPLSNFASFLELLNGIRPSINFSVEYEQDGSLPFLDILIQRTGNNASFSVYRKPTHTGRYLHRDSHHPIGVFKGLVKSLSSRALAICSSGNLGGEKSQLVNSLRFNGYTESECKKWWAHSRPDNSAKPAKAKFRGSLPYIRGVSEKICDILHGIGINAGVKPSSTLRSCLVHKRPHRATELGVVYQLTCAEDGCDWSYVGESGRTLEERRREHRRNVQNIDVERSEVARHVHDFQHQVDFMNMSVLDRERLWKKRIIKEAIWSRKLSSSNRTKFSISHQWSSCLSKFNS